MEALGLIEVNGYLAGVVVADAALKAANVELLNTEKIKGGLTTVELKGDVGAIQAAVDAGTYEAERLGALISSHVIPRMDDSVQQMLLSDWSDDQEEETLVIESSETLEHEADLVANDEVVSVVPEVLIATATEETVEVKELTPTTETPVKKAPDKKKTAKKKTKDKK